MRNVVCHKPANRPGGLRQLIYVCGVVFWCAIKIHGQTNLVTVSTNLALPRAAGVSDRLLASLNQFLAQSEKPAEENALVLQSELLATTALLDEFADLQRDGRFQAPNFYHPHLINVLPLSATNFLVQLAYLGATNHTPALRAMFTLQARLESGQFFFCSPLSRNTARWKSETIGATQFVYQQELNLSNATAYAECAASFDRKLKAPRSATRFFCCEDASEAARVLGIDYKSDYNGRTHNRFSFSSQGAEIIVDGGGILGAEPPDPHDLWHARLHRVVPVATINKPVDEGTAYLYGGSWGLTWRQILAKFQTFAIANPDADWLGLYTESRNFDPQAKYPLRVDYAINALLAEKIEKEQEFAAVLKLLGCGQKVPGNANYFQALEKITGIARTNFNQQIAALIQASP